MKNMLAALGILLFTSAAYSSEVKAPFGLTWGETKNQLGAKGVSCNYGTKRFLTCHESAQEHDSSKGTLKSCALSDSRGKTLPRPVSFGKYYSLAFDSADRLHCAYVVSDRMPNIFSNAVGAKGKALYVRVKSSLIKKYGQPTTVNDDFYCIAPNDCKNWGSVWEPSGGGKISMYLSEVPEAFRRAMAMFGKEVSGTGHLKLLYESPEIAGTDRAREKHRRKLEEAADDSGL